MFYYGSTRTWITLKPAMIGDELLEEVVVNIDHIDHMYAVVTGEDAAGTTIVMGSGEKITVAAAPAELVKLITEKGDKTESDPR
jgi:hypothetical protein